MKITIFDTVSDNYGSSRICRLIMKIIENAGNNVEAYVCEEHLPKHLVYAKKLPFPILELRTLRNNPFGFFYNFIKRLQIFWRQIPALLNETELVYCNTFGTSPVAFCCKLKGIPTVLHLHESSNSAFMSFFGRLLLPMVANRIICVSDAVAKSWKIQGHSKTRIVHNGIHDLKKSERALIENIRPYDLCFVGRLTEKKGFSFFLDTLEYLNNDKRISPEAPFRVLIAGGTLPGQSLPSQFKKIQEAVNIDVTYLGEIDDTSEVFIKSKVACIPSLFADPFPTVVLEAMRAGCAIVATELGGSKEALSGAYAELVKSRDIGGLNEAIIRLHSSWSLEVAFKNRKVFNLNFTFEKFSKRLLKLDILNRIEEQ